MTAISIQIKKPDELYASVTTPSTSTATQTNNSSASATQTQTATQSATSATTSSNNGSIMGADFYADDYDMSARDAANKANSVAGLHDQYERRKVNANDDREMNTMDKLADGGCRTVEVDTDGDGVMETLTGAEAMAQSFDSELDLYIEAVLLEAFEKFGSNGGRIWTGKEHVGVFGEEGIAFLKSKGITVDLIDNRTYSLSLCDENGNILEDANGGKGQILFGDWIIPDGYAQGTEMHMSSMLDMMGYDCISRADFIDKPNGVELYNEVITTVEQRLEEGAYQAGDRTVANMYGKTRSVNSGSGSGTSANGQTVDGMNQNGEESELEALEKEQKEKNKKEAREFYETKLEEAKIEYKETHGRIATGEDLSEIQSQVETQTISKYGIEATDFLK